MDKVPLVYVSQGILQINQGFRYNAGDVAPMVHSSLSHSSHQAIASAPVNEPDPGLGHSAPQRHGRLNEARIAARSRTAIDAQAFHFPGFHGRYRIPILPIESL